MRAAILILAACAAVGCGAATPTAPGCSTSDWVDRSAASADRRVGFGNQLGSSAVGYAPACIQIAAGQSVTFVGDFGTHPLVPAGGTANPIPNKDSGNQDTAVQFDSAGTYAYACSLHEPTMVGAVWVK